MYTKQRRYTPVWYSFPSSGKHQMRAWRAVQSPLVVSLACVASLAVSASGNDCSHALASAQEQIVALRAEIAESKSYIFVSYGFD